MKRTDKKSDCAINYSLEHIGDPWSLLIVRDIVFFDKHSFGEFLASPEHIGTSVLARRLATLEQLGILVKIASSSDGRKEEYWLSAKGRDLIPILLELAAWGATYDPQTGADPKLVPLLATQRQEVLRKAYSAVAIKSPK